MPLQIHELSLIINSIYAHSDQRLVRAAYAVAALTIWCGPKRGMDKIKALSLSLVRRPYSESLLFQRMSIFP